jgi:DNA polymerase-4
MPDPYAAAEQHMRELKARFPAEVGDYLRCSVGIASSKLVAKIASDLQKPDGMVVVRPEDVHKLYDVLELTDIPGIASRSAERLKAKLGIHSLKGLRDTPLSHLVGAFGRVAGYHMWAMGQLKGSWKEKVQADPSMKSMGHMYTLPKEYRKPECMLPILSRLSEMVATRLRKKGVSAGGVSAFVRVSLGWEAEKKKDHRWFGGALPLGGAVTDGRELFLSARKCLESDMDLSQVSSCYMVTITAYDLAERVEQLELFRNKPSVPELGKAMDAVNTRYGAHTLTRGTSLQAGHAIRDSVGFGRVKEK